MTSLSRLIIVCKRSVDSILSQHFGQSLVKAWAIIYISSNRLWRASDDYNEYWKMSIKSIGNE